MAIIAVVCAWSITTLTSRYSWPEWLVSAPSLAAVFTLLFHVFDRYLWRWPVLSRMGVVGIPDTSGTYEGKLSSTFRDIAGQSVQRDVVLRVRQTWTHMKVEMEVASGTSTSVSTSALGSVQSDGSATCLTYVYANRVNPALADSDMGDHGGTAELRIYADGRFNGRYYNSRPRAGTIQGLKKS